MSDIRTYIQDKIKSNRLDLNVEECLQTLEKYKSIYFNKTDYELFFYFILNKVGNLISSYLDEDDMEILGWLRVHISRKNIVYYQFETQEDYYNWLKVRTNVYNQLNNNYDIRLLNFLELSTMDFITDINTNCNYKLKDDKGSIIFSKNGFGVTTSNLSFIKYVGSNFKQNYVFIPL